MRRYRHEIDNVRAHLGTLKIIIGFQGLVIIALWYGWNQAPKHLRVHIPPDLRVGAQLMIREIPPPNVYSFALTIFQQLNRWPQNGADDYGKAIYRLSPYLTPRYRQMLIHDMEGRAKRGELSYRVRGVHTIPGQGYEAHRVAVASADRWTVRLDLELSETVKGMTVKQTHIRYPLRVVRLAIDPETNPWGLALDGYAELGPQRLAKEGESSPQSLQQESTP